MILAARLALALAALVLLSARAGSPEVSRGLAWLQAQVGADGALAGNARGAHPLQALSETVRTLAALSGPSAVAPPLTARLAAEAGDDTEWMARAALALRTAGRPSDSLEASLRARQAADGGFPASAAPGEPSTLLDTLWAHDALALADGGTFAGAARARAWLRAVQQADGGMAGESAGARVQATALAVQAFTPGAAADAAQQAAVLPMVAWLADRQQADGSWHGSVYLTAMGLHALTLQGADSAARGAARQWLVAAQAADGSWSGDAFLTAVALRALAAEPPATPVAAALAGRVVDAASGQPLAGATVELSGAAAQAATSGTQGAFRFSGLAAGRYELRVTLAGYAALVRPAELATGQQLDLGLLALAGTSTTGTIRGQVLDASGAPVGDALVALDGGAGARTDTQGRYRIDGVAPGTVGLTASRDGFRAVQASGTLAAGQTLVFSPTLTASSEPAPQPTAARFKGRAVDAQGQGLGGVSVAIGAATTGATGATGAFDLQAPAGNYRVAFSRSGYRSISADVLAASGSVVDFGDVVLQAVRTTTEVAGRVTDADTGTAIANAEVSGGGASARSAADGSYALSGITSTRFDLRVAAGGYLTQSWRLEAAEPAQVRKDFAMAPAGTGAVRITTPAASTGQTGANASVAVTASVEHTGGDPRDLVAQLAVLDAQGASIGLAPALAPSGSEPLGAFTLSQGEARPLRFAWNTGQFAPGAYTLLVRVVQAGSASRENPAGQVLATRSLPLEIRGEALFDGAVAAHPPVVRAQAATPVDLHAVIRSTGNLALPAQAYRLTIVDEAQGDTVATFEASAGALAPSTPATLSFGRWVPSRPGSFALRLAAATGDAQGVALGRLYAGDTATGAYTVDRPVVPTGTQTVRATVRITGEDAATGGTTNPLSAAIKSAIQKSVTYGDVQAAAWTAGNQCQGCHVQTQALVGGELSRGLTDHDPRLRNAIYNAVALYRQPDGALRDDAFGFSKAETLLNLWALNAWHKKDEITPTLASAASYTQRVQDGDGGWSTDYTGGWWTARASQTAFNVKNLVAVADQLGQRKPWVQHAAETFSEGGGLSGAYHLYNDAGRLLVTNSDAGTVAQIGQDGRLSVFASGIDRPAGMAMGPDGLLVVASRSGIYSVSPSGGTPRLLSPLADAMGPVFTPSGDLYVAHYGHNTVYRILPSGEAQPFLSGAPLAGPTSLAVDTEGRLVVVNYNARKIVRFRLDDKSYDTPVSLLYGNPRSVVKEGSGWLVGTNNGAYRFNADWQGQRLSFAPAEGVAVLQDGTIFTSDGGQRVYKLAAQAPDVDALVAGYDASAQRGAQWLLNDANINPSSNLELAHQLIGLGSAQRRFAGTPLAQTLHDRMAAVGAALKARQRADGGWGWYDYHGSDSMVTAQVGYALDYLNPSPQDPYILNAVQFLLARQQADGSWMSENGLFTTRYGATSWVEVWLPVALERVGGIDTDLRLRFAPDVHLANPSLAPTQSAAQPDGSTDYLWKLVGVTTKARQIEFDLTLDGLRPGESRPASTFAAFTFRNSFLGDSVDAPVDIPAVKASAYLGIGVSTDRAAYPASTPVAITARVSNSGAGAASGHVALAIATPAGGTVADLGRVPFSALAAGGTIDLPATWNTADTQAGSYRVVARLADAAGLPVEEAVADFRIVADASGGTGLTARVQTDRRSYEPTDTVRIANRLQNLAANQAWNDLKTTTTVTGPDGAERWSAQAAVSTLPAQGLHDFGHVLPPSGLPAGDYAVRLVARSAGGETVASATTTFAVRSTADTGAGVRGTLQAQPAVAAIGEPVQLSLALDNAGNADVRNATVRVRILDAGSDRVVATFTRPGVDLVRGTPLTLSWPWTADGTPGTILPAAASIEVAAGQEVTLSTTTIQLRQAAPAATVTAAIGDGSDARLLVLVACSVADDGQPPSAACDEAKAQALRDDLATRGLTAKVVTTRAEFETEMRCGRYNVYWISGGAQKLGDVAVREVREAARRGAGLLVDGATADRDAVLLEAIGVQAQGTSGLQGAVATLTGPVYPQGGGLPTPGQPQRLAAQGATVQATLTGGGVAVAGRAIGRGRGLAMAFSLSTLLARPGAGTDAFLGTFVSDTLQYLTVPAVNTRVPGSLQSLSTVLRNPGTQALQVTVRARLPQGAQALDAIPDASGAVAGASVVEWSVPLAAGASTQLILHATATAPGRYDVPWEISAVVAGASGAAPAVQTLGQSFEIREAMDLARDAQAAADAFAAAGGGSAASSARNAVASAVQSMGQGLPAQSLAPWTAAADALRGAAGTGADAARAAIAEALQSAQRQLCGQWACITGDLDFQVRGQSAREVPLQDTIVGSRTVFNRCPPQIKDIPVTSQWVLRRTGATVQHLWDNLTIPGYQNNRRDNGWQAQGQNGDVVDATLTAEWQGQVLHLDRDSFRIVVLPPVLAGSVSASPARARAGQNVTLSRTVRNSGAMGKDIPVQLRVVNLTRGIASVAWSQSMTLNPGETNSGNANWQVQGAAGDALRIELVATVNGTVQVLGTAGFAIEP
ncbi:carboxypeptidase regulatory-like domain-containing protein [Acidovorax sp. NCPPB 3859]|nr:MULTISPECIES: carboxypeptidase regulatory-like domain-containing protein [unclassified Acidovorax]MDA8450088.1 carboxypeptidase regulatory-like domain-containing protein [Acidovorax sp. GBBC 3297]MDA8459567.1 carboxypeptidase regulatory-like domain-containing protein [Acidovorax sp. GBBC 3333]MDA8464570.1 carboxypeptidase regulatory-like domain-containing protein [Acidovorax sp. GBBC 3332]MDA8469637.1 carboxypeptidase regulatory-like domain-containing protein [Acidovorax sp. GBBC 3299]WCM79